MSSPRCVADRVGASRCMCDAHRPRVANDYFSRDGAVPSGLVYDGKILRLTTLPMGDGDFGQVDLNSFPFEISLNSDVVQPRLFVSAVHEILHVLFELNKIEATHERLHACAINLATEGIPALLALRKVMGNNQNRS